MCELSECVRPFICRCQRNMSSILFHYSTIFLRQGLFLSLELGWWQARPNSLPVSIPHKAGIAGASHT